MFEPVKIGFGEYLVQFFNTGLVPTTKYLTEYAKRPVHQAILWAPGRMVDLAEEMLGAWQRDDSRGPSPTPAYTMPIILVAMAKDVMQSGSNFNKALSTPQYAVLPDDPKRRVFQVRTFSAAIRTQLVIAAHDEPTARALASQVLLWIEAFPRTFPAQFRFAGFEVNWPVSMVLPENPASAIATDAKNLTLLAVDLTLNATVPLYQAPKLGEPNDGKGDPENADDPAGYPVVVEIERMKP